jgi:uncharacterized Tic20 family protein
MYGLYQSMVSYSPLPGIDDVLNCSIVTENLKEISLWSRLQPSYTLGSDNEIAFEMIGDNYTDTLNQLDSIRSRQSKFICINDNMKNPTPELEKALHDFFESFFPVPSQFELKPGIINPTLYWDEYKLIKQKKNKNNYQLNHDNISFINFIIYKIDVVLNEMILILVYVIELLITFIHILLDFIETLIYNIKYDNNNNNNNNDKIENILHQWSSYYENVLSKSTSKYQLPITPHIENYSFLICYLIFWIIILIYIFKFIIKTIKSNRNNNNDNHHID